MQENLTTAPQRLPESSAAQPLGSVFDVLRQNVIGHDHVLNGPFGPRRLLYADYVASGRAFAPIENTIRQYVLPLYANTHTEASATGRQSSAFREQARSIIANAIGASDEDAIIFCGSGCTGAIDKLINILGLKIPDNLGRFGIKTKIRPARRPVVFIGPYEHHSNDVQWRESIADVVVIGQDDEGLIDLDDLKKQLIAHQDRPLKIGSFSAASNVTGILTDTSAIARLLHQYGALAAFDFAACAPYVPIHMNAPDGGYFDVVYISPHKFLGGPGTPGLLVIKKELAQNKTPVIPGGGTVSYVSPCAQAYLSDVVHREEGGTPDIVGSIRAGLVFDLKEKIGNALIASAKKALVKKTFSRWESDPNIKILGSETAARLPVFSFLIRHGDGFLHYNYVVTLLDDLFGIQARGGCSCAGPYGHQLLDIDLETSREYEAIIHTGLEALKPGWVRLGFTYFLSGHEVELILSAVEWIAKNGPALLPLYHLDSKTGKWTHKDHLNHGETLLDLSCLTKPERPVEVPESLEGLLTAANTALARAGQLPPPEPCADLRSVPAHLLWFSQSPQSEEQAQYQDVPPTMRTGYIDRFRRLFKAGNAAG